MTKLSELSKPVAWTDERGNLCTNRNKERGLESRYHQDYEKYTTPFYSQEYVSALTQRIAELEAIATDYAGKFQKAQDANKHLIIMSNDDKRLIAELEAEGKVWASAATKHLARAEEAEQRVAELSELETHNQCLIKKNADLTQQNIKLGERLATPVRLLGEMLLHDWEHSVERQATFQHRKIAWDARLAEDKKTILAAGFTFTVEGDEQ